MTQLKGRAALVTGAGQGIGQGIAFALADRGAAVAAVGRTKAKLDDTVHEIESRGGKAVAIVCDVKEPDEINATVAEAAKALGGLSILVNNAQEFCFGAIDDIPLDLIDAGWRSGPLATLLFMRAAHEHLRAAEGAIVNVGSSAAVDTSIAGIGVYSATKGAIEALSRAAAVEWADEGIRVNTIMPMVRSPAVAATLDAMPEMEKQVLAEIPLGRWGDAESEIGAAVAFLCGADASFITGTTLTVDGGAVRLR